MWCPTLIVHDLLQCHNLMAVEKTYEPQSEKNVLNSKVQQFTACILLLIGLENRENGRGDPLH
jgi:hypothetical protein